MASSDAPSPRLLRLSPRDNIAVATGTLSAGQAVRCDEATIELLDAAPVGHKVAVLPICKGDKVIKFGCPIGSATSDIAIGQHVHTHNLKSDYITAHGRDAVRIREIRS